MYHIMASEERITPIGELRAGLKNVHCIFIVIDRGSQQLTKDGSKVRKCRVADRTGSILFSVWNDEAEAINSGDIIKLTKGYASLWKGSLVLYCGKYGLVERLGEFTMAFSETPDMSIYNEAPPNSTPNSDRQVSADVANNGSTPAPLISGSNELQKHHTVESAPPTKQSLQETLINGHSQQTKLSTDYTRRSMHHHHHHHNNASHDNHMTHHLSSSNRPHPYSRQSNRESWR